MNILDYADVLNLNLEITYYHNQDHRFSAKFEYVEVKDGCMLSSPHGNGKNPSEAIVDYVSKISGETIVIHAMDKEKRREYKVPQLTY